MPLKHLAQPMAEEISATIAKKCDLLFSSTAELIIAYSRNAHTVEGVMPKKIGGKEYIPLAGKSFSSKVNAEEIAAVIRQLRIDVRIVKKSDSHNLYLKKSRYYDDFEETSNHSGVEFLLSYNDFDSDFSQSKLPDLKPKSLTDVSVKSPLSVWDNHFLYLRKAGLATEKMWTIFEAASATYKFPYKSAKKKMEQVIENNPVESKPSTKSKTKVDTQKLKKLEEKSMKETIVTPNDDIAEEDIEDTLEELSSKSVDVRKISAGGRKALSPLQDFFVNQSTNRVFYPTLYFLIIAFIGVWVANGMGMIVDGTGGNMVYTGHTDANGVEWINGEYDICSERQDLIDCQGTVTIGETYPCDPDLDSSNCANTLTPLKEHSSMPAGFYSDGILMIIIGMIGLTTVLYLHLILSINLKRSINDSEMVETNDSGNNIKLSEDEIEPSMDEPEKKVQSISETLSKYDDNADGKVDHFEISTHDGAGRSGGIGGFLDRILDDDPELRGQRLWVMFSLSLILVAALNAYAMLRAPDMITIDKILEHKNEVVAVEGILTSWVEDPYGSGDDRIDMIIEDETGVIELRWYRFGDIPPLGTYVRAIGDVIEYDGRLWLQAMGAGALSWSKSNVPEVFPTTVSEVAANPSNYSLTAITLTGYLSKSIEPEASFSSLYLGDHPNYGNSDHQMRMVIHSAPGKWLEAGQKVEVTGILSYEQRELRWTLHIEGPEIRTINTYTPPIAKLDWSTADTWSYSSNNIVEITGVLGEGWILSGENYQICIIPKDDPSAKLSQIITFRGRLLWSPSHNNWCIDEAADGTSSAGIVAVGDAVDLLGMISADPSGVLANSSKTWVVKAYSKYSVEPFDTDITFVDSPEYSSDWTTLYGSFDGTNTWIEAGQEMVINVSVGWDDANTRMSVTVNSFELSGETPTAGNIFWDDGATQWSYSRNKLVTISGQVIDEGGQYYLQREGGTQKVRLDPVIQAIGLNSDYSDYTLTWEGRLLQEDDNSNMAQAFVLANADAIDENSNGIPDELE